MELYGWRKACCKASLPSLAIPPQVATCQAKGRYGLANFSWNFRFCLSSWCLEADGAVPEAEGLTLGTSGLPLLFGQLSRSKVLTSRVNSIFEQHCLSFCGPESAVPSKVLVLYRRQY
jgi:hypothetical protein